MGWVLLERNGKFGPLPLANSEVGSHITSSDVIPPYRKWWKYLFFALGKSWTINVCMCLSPEPHIWGEMKSNII